MKQIIGIFYYNFNKLYKCKCILFLSITTNVKAWIVKGLLRSTIKVVCYQLISCYYRVEINALILVGNDWFCNIFAYHISNIGFPDPKKPNNHKGRENLPNDQHHTKCDKFFVTNVFMYAEMLRCAVFDFPLAWRKSTEIGQRMNCYQQLLFLSIKKKRKQVKQQNSNDTRTGKWTTALRRM